MGKFSDVVKGTRARRPIKLPLPGATVDPKTGEWVGPTVDLDIRPINDEDDAKVKAGALAFAKAHGLAEASPGDPLYEQGRELHLLAIACIDRSSPEDAPALFFDGGWEQIHKSEVMTPEVRKYLALQQEIFQYEVNPLMASMSKEEMIIAAAKMAGGDLAFFVNMQPGMQWSYTRTSAVLLMSFLQSNSPSSSSSELQPKIPS